MLNTTTASTSHAQQQAGQKCFQCPTDLTPTRLIGVKASVEDLSQHPVLVKMMTMMAGQASKRAV
jgi:hypothetical protein